jgi:hypothetical protein
MAIKYFQWPYNRPNGHKLNQHFPLQDPPKFTQIGIFGLRTNHLASLVQRRAFPLRLFTRRLCNSEIRSFLLAYKAGWPDFRPMGDCLPTAVM